MVNDPIKAKEHIEKAEELVEKEIYVDAVTEYESALEYEPGNEELYMKISRCLSEKRRQPGIYLHL